MVSILEGPYSLITVKWYLFQIYKRLLHTILSLKRFYSKDTCLFTLCVSTWVLSFWFLITGSCSSESLEPQLSNASSQPSVTKAAWWGWGWGWERERERQIREWNHDPVIFTLRLRERQRERDGERQIRGWNHDLCKYMKIFYKMLLVSSWRRNTQMQTHSNLFNIAHEMRKKHC